MIGRLQKLTINLDLSPENIHDLIRYTNNGEDQDLQNNTSDASRFATLPLYKAWLAKDRTIYSLVTANGVLAGIIWFGYQPLVMDGHTLNTTYAIRLYGPYRGKGLSKPFTAKCLAHYRSLHPGCDPIWLETNANNLIAITAYKSLGCRVVSGQTENGRVVLKFPLHE